MEFIPNVQSAETNFQLKLITKLIQWFKDLPDALHKHTAL